MMTPHDVTDGMLDILNEGVAGMNVADLITLANGLLMANKTPGAMRIGNMLHAMVALNQEYCGALECDPWKIPPLI